MLRVISFRYHSLMPVPAVWIHATWRRYDMGTISALQGLCEGINRWSEISVKNALNKLDKHQKPLCGYRTVVRHLSSTMLLILVRWLLYIDIARTVVNSHTIDYNRSRVHTVMLYPCGTSNIILEAYSDIDLITIYEQSKIYFWIKKLLNIDI